LRELDEPEGSFASLNEREIARNGGYNWRREVKDTTTRAGCFGAGAIARVSVQSAHNESALARDKRASGIAGFGRHVGERESRASLKNETRNKTFTIWTIDAIEGLFWCKNKRHSGERGLDARSAKFLKDMLHELKNWFAVELNWRDRMSLSFTQYSHDRIVMDASQSERSVCGRKREWRSVLAMSKAAEIRSSVNVARPRVPRRRYKARLAVTPGRVFGRSASKGLDEDAVSANELGRVRGLVGDDKFDGRGISEPRRVE
jgi:hypothetical protein